MVNQIISLILSNTTVWLSVTAIVVILLVIDRIITNLPIYDLKTQKSFEILFFYGTIILASALSQVIYLKMIKRRYGLNPDISNFKKHADITHLVVSSAQYFIIASLIVTLVEIVILKKYDTFTVRILIQVFSFL